MAIADHIKAIAISDDGRRIAVDTAMPCVSLI
jgi:hypothetical protein